MTKQLKKGLVTVLLFVMAIVCALSVNNFVPASAAADKETQFIDNVAAFKTEADADANGSLSADEIRTAMGTDADTYFNKMYNHVLNEFVNGSTNSDYLAAKAQYDIIMGEYNKFGVVTLYSELSTTIYDIISLTSGRSYKDNGDVVSARTDFNTLANDAVAHAQDLAFLYNSDLEFVEVSGVKTPKNLVDAEAKMALWKGNIQTAIDYIKALQVYVKAENENDTVAIFDGTAYRAVGSYEVVLKSNNSYLLANAAYNTVKNAGDEMFLNGTVAFEGDSTNHYAQLKIVGDGIVAQNNKVQKVIDLIDTAFGPYEATAGKEVCYTIKDLIFDARDEYDDLDGADYSGDTIDDNLNNLKAAVTNYSDLTTMLSDLSDITNRIGDVYDLIDDIPADVKYDFASWEKIDAARKAFDLLDKDVVDNDKDVAKNGGTYCVTNYGKLVDAEDLWENTYVKQVNDLIAAIKNLRTTETTKPTAIYAEFADVQALYNNLADKNNQLAGDEANDIKGVRPELLDAYFTPAGYSEVKNCGQSYDYYKNLAQKIATATTPIIEAIDAWNTLDGGNVRLTDACEAKYVDITDRIAQLPKGDDGKLDQRYQGAISNFVTYENLAEEYLALVEIAETWAEKVNAIGVVSVNNFDKVAEAETAFTAIVDAYAEEFGYATKLEAVQNDLDDYSRVSVKVASTEFETIYDTFVLAKASVDDIIAALDAVVTEIEAIGDRPAIGGDYVTYKNAVAAATAKYAALVAKDDPAGAMTTQEYFKTYADEDATNKDYSEYYADYRAALINVEANAIEVEIAKIFNNSTDNENYIGLAREKYETYAVVAGADYTAEEVKAQVRNYEKPEGATDDNYLVSAEKVVQGWINNVNKLLEEASFKGENVLATAIDPAIVIDSTTVVEGIFKLNVTDANTYANAYTGFTAVQKAYVSGTTYNLATANTLLTNIIAIVGVNTYDVYTHNYTATNKIGFIDKALYDFKHAYDNGNSNAQIYETLINYLSALDGTQANLLHNKGAFESIAQDNEMAEQLSLAINKLYADVKNGEISTLTAVTYHIIEGIYDGLNSSQKGLVVVNCDGKTVEDALEYMLTAIESAQKVYTFDELSSAISALETTVNGTDGLVDKLAQVENDIKSLAKASDITDLQSKIDEINNATTGILAQAKGYVDAEILKLKTALEAKDTELAAEIVEEIGRIEKAFGDADADLEAKIAQCLVDAKDYADAEILKLKTALEAADTKLTEDLAKEIKDRADAITALETALKAADAKLADDLAAAKTELEGKLADAQKALEDAIKAEEDARKAEDAAIKADLEAAVASLNSTITTITIILSVVCAGLAACVVLLFLKKRA